MIHINDVFSWKLNKFTPYRLEITSHHNSMVLSTLSMNPRGSVFFAVPLYNRNNKILIMY